MKKLYREAANKSGVYKLTNMLNNRFYYGSCKRFKQRWREHELALLKNNHKNYKLQNAWNKYGSDVFVFEIVEIVEGTRKDWASIEQKYLDQNYGDGSMCYNIRRDTVQKQGPWSSTPEETRKKKSEIMKGKKYHLGHKHSEETKKKMIEMRSNVSEETRKKMSIAKRNMSEETKKKIGAAGKGRTPWNKGKTGVYSKETREKISKSLKGKKFSKETREKISKALSGKNNPMYGKPGTKGFKNKKHTEETKRKMRKAKLGLTKRMK